MLQKVYTTHADLEVVFVKLESFHAVFQGILVVAQKQMHLGSVTEYNCSQVRIVTVQL